MGKELNVGAELSGEPHTITQDKLVAFERVIWHRVANVHSNSEVAKKVGMSKVIASGQNQLAFLHQLMETRFGDGWIYGGKISARWVSPVYVDDVITPCALIKEITEQDGKRRAHMDIWCTNQSGTKTALGSAEAYLQ
jgi:3-hydroxybutyryl-CoA dehydratase